MRHCWKPFQLMRNLEYRLSWAFYILVTRWGADNILKAISLISTCHHNIHTIFSHLHKTCDHVSWDWCTTLKCLLCLTYKMSSVRLSIHHCNEQNTLGHWYYYHCFVMQSPVRIQITTHFQGKPYFPQLRNTLEYI